MQIFLKILTQWAKFLKECVKHLRDKRKRYSKNHEKHASRSKRRKGKVTPVISYLLEILSKMFLLFIFQAMPFFGLCFKSPLRQRCQLWLVNQLDLFCNYAPWLQEEAGHVSKLQQNKKHSDNWRENSNNERENYSKRRLKTFFSALQGRKVMAVSALCKVVWFLMFCLLNHATLNDADWVIIFSTVHRLSCTTWRS